MKTLTDQQLLHTLFKSAPEATDILAPLLELAEDSGYLISKKWGSGPLSETPLYQFDLVGYPFAAKPLRVLLSGSWTGDDFVGSVAIARILALFEKRISLLEGLEVSAFPVYSKADKKSKENFQASVLKNKLFLESFDLFLLVEEAPSELELHAEVWTRGGREKALLKRFLTQTGRWQKFFRWSFQSKGSPHGILPVSLERRAGNPVMVKVSLPGAIAEKERTDEGLAFVVALLHSFRHARLEGLV